MLVWLQGVWLPAGVSDNGRLVSEDRAAFPPSPGPWLTTVRGDWFHVTANADHYATSGRLRVGPGDARLRSMHPELPGVWEVPNEFRLTGDEPHRHCGGVE